MPTYEYACKDCGHAFEALVRSDTVPQCPQCQSTSLKKQLSVFATIASTTESAPMITDPCGACPNAMGQGGVHFTDVPSK